MHIFLYFYYSHGNFYVSLKKTIVIFNHYSFSPHVYDNRQTLEFLKKLLKHFSFPKLLNVSIQKKLMILTYQIFF